jgi:hypothetical protein
MADDREIPSVPGLFASGSASPSDMFGESGPQRRHGLVAGDLLPVKGDRDCRVEQLVLFGQPRPIRIPEQRSPSWLEDPVVAARLEAKRDKQPTRLCWPWIGGPSTGHGSFRAASLPGPSRRGTVPAHRFAYELAYGGSSNWGGPGPTMPRFVTAAISPAAPTLRTCGWVPTPPTGPNTWPETATRPAHWPMCAAPPEAPAPSLRPSELA